MPLRPNGQNDKNSPSKKNGRSHKKKQKGRPNNGMKKPPFKKKRALKIKQNEGHSPSKTDEQKGALHSNKPTVPTSSKLTLYWFYFSPLSNLVLSYSCQLLVIFHIGFFRNIIATYYDTLPYSLSIIFFCHMMFLMVLTFSITPKFIHDMTCFH